MSKILSKPDATKILSNVPQENVFRFCTAEGVYTKISAFSLEDFADKLAGKDEKSILFHYPRGRFSGLDKRQFGRS
jgi:hypothetical protein